MSLRGVIPKTKIDGFSTELIKHREPLLTRTESDATLIDYCYEIGVICEGTNPRYSKRGRAAFVITQFTKAATEGVVIDDEKLPIIIIGQHETLSGIQLVEAGTRGQQQALLVISIIDRTRDTRRTLAWIIKKAELPVLH